MEIERVYIQWRIAKQSFMPRGFRAPKIGKSLVQQVRLRVGHVHLTPNEAVPLCNTNSCYTWLVRAAVASHS